MSPVRVELGERLDDAPFGDELAHAFVNKLVESPDEPVAGQPDAMIETPSAWQAVVHKRRQ